jgi:hypothetical protein
VGADLLVERQQRGPYERNGGAANQRHTHQEHPYREQDPSHAPTE